MFIKSGVTQFLVADQAHYLHDCFASSENGHQFEDRDSFGIVYFLTDWILIIDLTAFRSCKKIMFGFVFLAPHSCG